MELAFRQGHDTGLDRQPRYGFLDRQGFREHEIADRRRHRRAARQELLARGNFLVRGHRDDARVGRVKRLAAIGDAKDLELRMGEAS